MRLALYARVSTEDQSLDSQLHALRDYASKRGFTIVKEFTDKGVSGAKNKRPGLDQLMDQVRKGKFDGVMVFRFDRFARSTSHLAQALDEFRSLGVQFISFSENVDTTTPMGQAMFTIIGAMAQLERDIIIERVKAGINAAKARGVHTGRPFTVDVAEVRKLRAEGLSKRAIAKQMSIGLGSVSRALTKV